MQFVRCGRPRISQHSLQAFNENAAASNPTVSFGVGISGSGYRRLFRNSTAIPLCGWWGRRCGFPFKLTGRRRYPLGQTTAEAMGDTFSVV